MRPRQRFSQLVALTLVIGALAASACADSRAPSRRRPSTRTSAVAAPPCVRTGCHGEVCAAAAESSTCGYLAEYACFDALGTCAPDADGACAWADTPALAACIDTAQATAWRSTLYPTDWTPGFRDPVEPARFLHDFSYAGYRNGEAPLPDAPPGKRVDVVAAYGADPTGARDATASIQRAIDDVSAAGGGVVVLSKGTFRCDGRLFVRASGLVLRGAGADDTRVYFTRSAGMAYSAHLTFRGAVVQGPDVPLARDGEALATTVAVADARSFAVGDDVSLGWVITDAFVDEHGMKGTWRVFNGTWTSFFRRTVRAVDRTSVPNTVTLDVPLRYPAKLRDRASLRRETGYLREVGLESLSIANAVAWDDAWKERQVRAVEFEGVTDAWVRRVRSFAPPVAGTRDRHLQGGGIKVLASKRVTIAESRLERAQNRGDGGCGYLFELSQSSEVLVRDSVGAGGRHNFVQNWGFGTSGCVFLRCASSDGVAVWSSSGEFGTVADSEYHHSLATACLVDQSTADDGWSAVNRGSESSGAGHSATQSVFWNVGGKGRLRSRQLGWGYVIGTRGVEVLTSIDTDTGRGTAPEDFVEGLGDGDTLEPPSLYDDQLKRRLGR